MGAETDPGTPPGGAGEPASTEDPLTKLQEEFTRIGAQERGKGETAGKRDLLTKLGFANTDEAVAAVTAWRDSGDPSEITGQLQTSEAKRVEAERRVAELDHSFRLMNTLVTAGVRPERVGQSLQLVLAELRGLPEAPNDAQLAEAVTAFKTSTPEFFAAPAGEGDPSLTPKVPGTPGLNGGTNMPGSQHGTDPARRGLDAFAARHGKSVQQAQS